MPELKILNFSASHCLQVWILLGALFKSDQKDGLPKGKEACSARYWDPLGPEIWIKNFCKKPAIKSLSTSAHSSLHMRPTSSPPFHPPSILGRVLAASLSTSERTCPTSPSFTQSAVASSDPASFSLSFFNPFCPAHPPPLHFLLVSPPSFSSLSLSFHLYLVSRSLSTLISCSAGVT